MRVLKIVMPPQHKGYLKTPTSVQTLKVLLQHFTTVGFYQEGSTTPWAAAKATPEGLSLLFPEEKP